MEGKGKNPEDKTGGLLFPISRRLFGAQRFQRYGQRRDAGHRSVEVEKEATGHGILPLLPATTVVLPHRFA